MCVGVYVYVCVYGYGYVGVYMYDDKGDTIYTYPLFIPHPISYSTTIYFSFSNTAIIIINIIIIIIIINMDRFLYNIIQYGLDLSRDT